MATKMKATKVYRGGHTQKIRRPEAGDVRLDFKASYRESGEESFQERKNLTLDFSMNSKGGGITDVHISIGLEDFAPLIDAMAKVDRGAALSAMSAELAKQLKNGE